MTTISKIIKEGSYGCIFRPGINCLGETVEDSKFVTKIQAKKDILTNEIEIGKIIKEIENYKEYFSPIIENCPIKLTEIETTNRGNVEECNIVNKIKNDPELQLNKILYVGNNTLWNYLLLVLKENPHKFTELLLESHITLLDGLKKLIDAGIIHNDIKENNIVCRDIDGRPIIIDFGLSMEKRKIHLPESWEDETLMYKYFFKYDSSYSPWSIDIVMMNYMMNNLNKTWLSSMVTREQINELLIYVEDKNRKIVDEMLTKYINLTWETLINILYENNNDDWLRIIYNIYGYKWKELIIEESEIISIIKNKA
jgi:serine/threonine protein kinase